MRLSCVCRDPGVTKGRASDLTRVQIEIVCWKPMSSHSKTFFTQKSQRDLFTWPQVNMGQKEILCYSDVSWNSRAIIFRRLTLARKSWDSQKARELRKYSSFLSCSLPIKKRVPLNDSFSFILLSHDTKLIPCLLDLKSPQNCSSSKTTNDSELFKNLCDIKFILTLNACSLWFKGFSHSLINNYSSPWNHWQARSRTVDI